MHWLLLGLLGGFAFVFLTRVFWTEHPKNPGSPLVKAAIVVLVLSLLLLVTTGRAHWLSAALAGSIPFLRRATGLLRYAPALVQLWTRLRGATGQPHSRPDHANSAHSDLSAGPKLSVTQARLMLEVPATATTEEIIAAHRRLISRNHPDKGGSTYIAAQLNAAKDLLLEKRNS